MPRQTLQDEIAIHNAIDEFLEKSPMTSISEIADYVEKKTKIRPADSTISNHISDKGFKKVWVKED